MHDCFHPVIGRHQNLQRAGDRSSKPVFRAWTIILLILPFFSECVQPGLSCKVDRDRCTGSIYEREGDKVLGRRVPYARSYLY